MYIRPPPTPVGSRRTARRRPNPWHRTTCGSACRRSSWHRSSTTEACGSPSASGCRVLPRGRG
eukprot:15347912-Heterocapsa_arctica.AAC.1